MSTQAEFKNELRELLGRYQVEISLVENTIAFFSYDVFEDGEIKHNGVDFNGSFFSGDSV
tara:strand:+ start:60 stop:239 length:180 start_codon:yes stop_codon:yes gene_type:complete